MNPALEWFKSSYSGDGGRRALTVAQLQAAPVK